MQMRLAQVVYTITQFPTVKGVVFSLDGDPIDVLGGEDHHRPAADSGRLRRPPSDDPGHEPRARPGGVGNPVLISGSANVFEANVSVKILDSENDEVIAETDRDLRDGCRGTYRVSVPYEVDHAQDGTIVVHDDDAAGVGRPPHEVGSRSARSRGVKKPARSNV